MAEPSIREMQSVGTEMARYLRARHPAYMQHRHIPCGPCDTIRRWGEMLGIEDWDDFQPEAIGVVTRQASELPRTG